MSNILEQQPELAQYHPEVIQNPQGEMLVARFDVSSLLESKVGPDWQEQVTHLVSDKGELAVRTADHWTVREEDTSTRFGLTTVDGAILAQEVPGIWELYKGEFKHLMHASLPAGVEPLESYGYPELALECVSQKPVSEDDGIQHRYEAHVDQRYTAVLVIEVPEVGTEGRLVIANNPEARNVEEIDADATTIAHRAATLVCFSRGRFYPHYTEQIKSPDSKRITVALNYPVEGESREDAVAILEHIKGVQDER